MWWIVPAALAGTCEGQETVRLTVAIASFVAAEVDAVWPGMVVLSDEVDVLLLDSDGRRWLTAAEAPRRLHRGFGGGRLEDCGQGPESGTRGLHVGAAVDVSGFPAAFSVYPRASALYMGAPERAPFTFLEWLSVFVHESVHAHQDASPAWAPVFQAASNGAPLLARLHQADADLRALVAAELTAAADILRAEDPLAAVNALIAARAATDARLSALSDGAVAARLAVEQVEGSARFVEVAFFRSDVGPGLSERGRLGLGLGIADDNFAYATGFGALAALERLGIRWRDQIATRDLSQLLEAG